jgi:hypothetical protein
MLAGALHAHGLILRGGFALEPDDHLGEGALLMVGNAGGAMWAAFQRQQRNEADPLDNWTKRTVDPLADRFGARPIYPFDRPHPPIQRWAKRAEGLGSSPLGLLIHPVFGLWHAYRTALVFPSSVAGLVDIHEPMDHPCESCLQKPCLTACPVEAFSPGRYDVPACASYLASADGQTCKSAGCAARNACPAGTEFRYSDDQIRFHMAAFSRSIA